MGQLTVTGSHPLRGDAGVPGDKSITHRALLLGALADGTSLVRGALLEGDCHATLDCVGAMGVSVSHTIVDGHEAIALTGKGLRGLDPPANPLNCGRSGTTMRLLSGILAGQQFDSVLGGDEQLLRRPMGRIVTPLRLMGARIEDQAGHAPLRIAGGPLHGIDYELPVASAQVKSAILLAGLLADGVTTVRSPAVSRDHTERMLGAMGAEIAINGKVASITPVASLAPIDLIVPGDISSAAFLLAAGVIVPGSNLVLRDVGLNPTRTGILDVLQSMGGDVAILSCHEMGGEPAGDLRIRAGSLHGVEISGDLIPRLIDELPALAVVATQAEGVTVVRDAAELRVKETDRIEAMVTQLRRLGARVEGRPDGMVIEGPTRLTGAPVSGGGDHRIAMSLLVAGLVARGSTTVVGTEVIADSYPGFVTTLRQLGMEVAG